MRQVRKLVIKMTIEKFRSDMLGYACGAGKVLCELTVNPEGIKLEPEQVRKNVATILVLLTETLDFLSDVSNDCSDSV